MTYPDRYAQYLLDAIPEAGLDVLSHVEAIGERTNWDEPQTPLDWNNFGVLTLIKAESAPSLTEKRSYVDLAFGYFQKGFAHPLGVLHHGLLLNLIGESGVALNQYFHILVQYLQDYWGKGESVGAGLIYLPPKFYRGLERVLSESNGLLQSYLMVGMVLPSMGLATYEETRWVNLANALCPQFLPTVLKQALSHIYCGLNEGLLYLHQAQKLEPHNPAVVQSLYLAYKKMQNPIASNYWREMARNFYLATDPENPDWFWATLGDRDDFTYVFFQQSILLAVLPDLAQIVTIVLLAEGDWFEGEMEFWIGQIQPGMVVIDVGANVGVYTFSAARGVGETGRVIAIEPFPPCVTCLEETRRVNNYGQVVIKQAVASSQPGTLHLATFRSSEVNALTIDPDLPGIEVESITIDDLVVNEGLANVHILKIDAEGHEMEVLRGATQVLEQYSPLIMYENISAQSSNPDVVVYLQERGYKLYRYRPFFHQMLPIEKPEELNGVLNVIAYKG